MLSAAVALRAEESLRAEDSLQPRWPRQGHWTYEDYLRLPEDGTRYEIIHGVLYMANAPSYDHQYAVSELHWRLSVFIRQRELGVVLTSPFEIHLATTVKPVQPDVFFIAKERLLKRGDQVFKGAPDLVIEVLSKSSLRLDRVIKFAAYEQAGVREYWIVDPVGQVVEVYILSSEPPEYMLHGQFCAEEQVSSVILPELQVAVFSLFLPV
jgi:Uma2 family endonuclease